MTHRMYEVPLETPGKLWLMAAPPPKQLREVVGQCKHGGIGLVVSLLGQEEASALGLADEGAVCAGEGISFTAFPIVDFGVPEGGFDALIGEIADKLRDGEGVAVHCRAGIGRAGTTASCVVQELGHDAAKAMAMVGKARGITIPETGAQRAFIEAYGERAG